MRHPSRGKVEKELRFYSRVETGVHGVWKGNSRGGDAFDPTPSVEWWNVR
jgi:hypothetical protein